MATFPEWSARHGITSARSQFGLSTHLVFCHKPGKVLYGSCGRWIASEPLAGGQDVEVAKQRLRDAIDNCFATEETIIE